MKQGLTVKDITPGMQSAVKAYLMSRAYAETMREAVDKIEREILKECPLTNDLEINRGKPAREITEPKHVYLCDNDDLLEEHYTAVNHRLRAEGLKPDDMPDDHCPALVAEHLQMDAEHLVVESTAEMLGEEDFLHRLICHGMDKYHKFIDLVTGMIVNMPGFECKI